MPITASNTVVALVGLPRSGTTLLARLIGAHSRVATLIEPYQSRRQLNYEHTDLGQLCADCKVEVPVAGAVLIKETTTRWVNVKLVLQTLRIAAEAGHATGIILLLRSPVEAFYSQLAAANKYWKDKTYTWNEDESSVLNFWISTQDSLEVLAEQITCFPLRVCFFARLLSEPAMELGRLMAFFRLEVEPGQFDVEKAAKKTLRGGDPNAWDKDKPVSPASVTDRTAQVAAFRDRFGQSPGGRALLAMHDCVTELGSAPLFDDAEVAGHFFRQFRKVAAATRVAAP